MTGTWNPTISIHKQIRYVHAVLCMSYWEREPQHHPAAASVSEVRESWWRKLKSTKRHLRKRNGTATKFMPAMSRTQCFGWTHCPNMSAAFMLPLPPRQNARTMRHRLITLCFVCVMAPQTLNKAAVEFSAASVAHLSRTRELVHSNGNMLVGPFVMDCQFLQVPWSVISWNYSYYN